MDEFSFDLGTQRNRLCLEIFIVCNAPHNINKLEHVQAIKREQVSQNSKLKIEKS